MVLVGVTRKSADCWLANNDVTRCEDRNAGRSQQRIAGQPTLGFAGCFDLPDAAAERVGHHVFAGLRSRDRHRQLHGCRGNDGRGLSVRVQLDQLLFAV